MGGMVQFALLLCYSLSSYGKSADPGMPALLPQMLGLYLILWAATFPDLYLNYLESMARFGWPQMLGLYIILWVTLGLGLLWAAAHFLAHRVYGTAEVSAPIDTFLP